MNESKLSQCADGLREIADGMGRLKGRIDSTFYEEEKKKNEGKERKTEGRHGYNAEAVNKAISSSNQFGPKIGGREASAIHRLLKGR